jgi:hypothetical protein
LHSAFIISAVDGWTGGEWVTFGLTIAVVVGILFLLWQSPQSHWDGFASLVATAVGPALRA